jgi:signal recognition particle GTPase
MSGKGHLFMLVGEPGSGKTRMTEQLAAYACLCNAQVLAGSCYERRSAGFGRLQIIVAMLSKLSAGHCCQ